MISLLIGFPQLLDKLEFSGFSTHAVILSVATKGSEVEESSHLPAAWHKPSAKILRLASLAQDDNGCANFNLSLAPLFQ